MAKVKGPLFSLAASGQIAKTLVYMSWKGIADVRKYVIPANPNTAGQQEQRGFFSTAVGQWHTDGFTAVDVAAWNLYALALKVAQSGFNVCTKLKVLALVAGNAWSKLVNCLVTAITAVGCTVTVTGVVAKVAKLYIGTSKTSMFTEFVGVDTAGEYVFTITDLSALTKYYFYIKNTFADDDGRTGIYSFTTIAA